ncbi:hypothetical protein PtA15_9A261 [Puccinia triticina]|uniref:Peptide N-acetyl-beta-D-glucosaminyl asparaginase amidase A N-terminal domain-containing protein n=1 Tax=Puccinia triticina TaxID=208348 RepID=A0ABY7CVL7_9BASI|nr:uncharacterized protein PtA15_9A261 [Puccinia triticina]WAQ88136.1 hypothetical protein PtA15_9A261 [Puccinia triticina]
MWRKRLFFSVSWNLLLSSVCLIDGHEAPSAFGFEGEQFLLPENHLLPSAFSRPMLGRRQIMGAQRLSTTEGLLKNLQVTQPPVVPQQGKSCTRSLLQTTFGNSFGKPARVSYSAPKDCGESGSWASVILRLTFTSRGTQFDRLSSIFLSGVEICNFVGIDGVFYVELSATYYMATADFPAPKSPAVIIPLSDSDSTTFSVPKAATIAVRIPPVKPLLILSRIPSLIELILILGVFFLKNAVSAAVEIYASGSDKEEFWYTNSLDQVVPALNKTSNDNYSAKGSFREVQLWIPIAAYGSLDQPTYQVDITPFLPLLTDSKSHNFTLTVEGQGENRSINSKWFLSGNIAMTLDASGKRTTGEIVGYQTEPTINVAGGEVAQLSTGSSTSATDSVVTFSDAFSFPLRLTLQNTPTGLKGEINLTYNRKLKPAVSGLATSIQTTQIAAGTLELADQSRASGGLGQTGQAFFYTDERGSSFSRNLIIKNVTEILKDVQSGSLATPGPQKRR